MMGHDYGVNKGKKAVIIRTVLKKISELKEDFINI